MTVNNFPKFQVSINQQLPDIYPVARQSDDRLTELLDQYQGSRTSKWVVDD
jgi:hypothetical protein